MKCSNCGAVLSCGCQKKVASNGASVCSNCLSSYEIALKNKAAKSSNDDASHSRMKQQTAPVVTGINVKIGGL